MACYSASACSHKSVSLIFKNELKKDTNLKNFLLGGISQLLIKTN